MEIFRQRWWLELTKGIVILAFGLYSLVRPAQALTVIGMIAGIGMLCIAVVTIMSAFELQRISDNWWILLIEGIANAILAIILLVVPREAADMLVRILGIWVTIIGVFRFIRLFMLENISKTPSNILGIGGILAGLILVVYPQLITLSITVIVGTVFSLFGVFIILDSIRQKQNLNM